MKHKLFYIFIALAVLGGIAFAFSAKEKDLYSSLTSTVVNQASEAITKVLTDQLLSIRSSLFEASSEAIKEEKLCDNFEEELDNLKDKTDVYLEIGKDNKVECATDEKFIGLNALDFNKFDQFFSDPNHYPRVSHIFSINGSEKLIAGYVPVYNKQNYLGSIAAMTYVSNLGTHLPRPGILDHYNFATLFDDNGDILYNSDKNLRGKNISSQDIQQSFSFNQKLNDAFTSAASGNTTQEKVVYIKDNKDYVGKFTPVAVGPNHNFIIFTSFPNF